MTNFAPQLKQQTYSNPFREDYRLSVTQEGVSNADLLGQAFTGLGRIAATGYKLAELSEEEDKEARKLAKAKADEAAKERTIQTYNDFARKQMLINEKAEQTQQWTNRDLESRKLLDQYSRMPGIEYGKLLELAGKTDFTGYYAIEKNARQKYDTARIERELKAYDALVAARPEVGESFTPKEGISYMNYVNNRWDDGMKYVSELKNIDRNADPYEYARVEREVINNLKDNVAATSILSIMRGTKGLQTDTEIQQFTSKEIQRLVRNGVAPEKAAIITQVGVQRSGILGIVKAINNEHTLYQEDVKRLMATRETDGYVLMGATETPYAAMWVKTDDFRSGQYLQTEDRLADKYMRELIPALAESRETNFTPTMSPEIRGNVYSMGSKIIKGNIGTPVLKGKVLKHMLSDATGFYGDKDAATRQQAYEAILKEYDNPYTDAVIKALQSDAEPFRRDMGNELAKQMQFLRDSKNISVFESSMTPAANSFRLLKQGPGADLLRVTEDGELVMIDGSKGFLQSAAITLSDMTGRYFGAAADMNEYFGEIYKDAETRKKMLEAGGIKALDPVSETIIGRKEWYHFKDTYDSKGTKALKSFNREPLFKGDTLEEFGNKVFGGYYKDKVPEKEMEEMDAALAAGQAIEGKQLDKDTGALLDALEGELKPNVRRAVEGTLRATATTKSSSTLANAKLSTDDLSIWKDVESSSAADTRAAQGLSEYDTELGASGEAHYQEWKKTLPEQLQSEEDYDLRGYYKETGGEDAEGHLTDKYKKPNHPTFSTESKYYKKGIWAGKWNKNGDFEIPEDTPADKLHELMNYWATGAEKGHKIIMGELEISL